MDKMTEQMEIDDAIEEEEISDDYSLQDIWLVI